MKIYLIVCITLFKSGFQVDSWFTNYRRRDFKKDLQNQGYDPTLYMGGNKRKKSAQLKTFRPKNNDTSNVSPFGDEPCIIEHHTTGEERIFLLNLRRKKEEEFVIGLREYAFGKLKLLDRADTGFKLKHLYLVAFIEKLYEQYTKFHRLDQRNFNFWIAICDASRRGAYDSVIDSSVLSNPADAQNISCLGLSGRIFD